jgi:hypothetical protein
MAWARTELRAAPAACVFGGGAARRMAWARTELRAQATSGRRCVGSAGRMRGDQSSVLGGAGERGFGVPVMRQARWTSWPVQGKTSAGKERDRGAPGPMRLAGSGGGVPPCGAWRLGVRGCIGHRRPVRGVRGVVPPVSTTSVRPRRNSPKANEQNYSVGRVVPNMISSQDGTEERRDRPPAAFRAGRSRGTAAAGGLSGWFAGGRAWPGAGTRACSA